MKQQRRIYNMKQEESIMNESSRGKSRENWMKAKGDYQDPVNSDQMVLAVFR